MAKYLTGKIPCKLVAAKRRSRFSGAAGYSSIIAIFVKRILIKIQMQALKKAVDKDIDMADMEIWDPLSLSSFLDKLLTLHPNAHEEVTIYIRKDSRNDHYISEYRHVSCVLEATLFPGTVQRVRMYDDFKTSVLDMKYHPIIGD